MTAKQTRSRRFLVVFAICALAQFGLVLTAPLRPLVDGLSIQLARISASVIHLWGGTCLQHAAVLMNPSKGFAMEVRDGCNGLNVVILLWSAILGYPAVLKWKAAGLFGGLAAIQLLNLLRLISLFYLGQVNFSLFEFAHLYLWEMLIMIDGMVVFGLWIKRAQTQ